MLLAPVLYVRLGYSFVGNTTVYEELHRARARRRGGAYKGAGRRTRTTGYPRGRLRKLSELCCILNALEGLFVETDASANAHISPDSDSVSFYRFFFTQSLVARDINVV